MSKINYLSDLIKFSSVTRHQKLDEPYKHEFETFITHATCTKFDKKNLLLPETVISCVFWFHINASVVKCPSAA